MDGFEISRAQFNLLFEDVVKAIQQLKLQTGLRPSVTDLGAAVHVPSNYKGERAPVAANQWATIYTGTYLGERVTGWLSGCSCWQISDLHTHPIGGCKGVPKLQSHCRQSEEGELSRGFLSSLNLTLKLCSAS